MTVGSWEEESCWSPKHQDQTQTEKQLLELEHFSVTERDQEQALIKGFQKNVDLNENHSIYEESDNLDGVTKHEYPIRSYAEDCPFYLRTGFCKFGFNCKFNHPVRRVVQERGGFVEQPSQIQCKFYRSTGGCKNGEACRFSHNIVKSKIQPSEINAFDLPIKSEKENKSEGSVEKTTKIECKYYLSAGGCKYGKACKFNHPKEKSCTYIKKPNTAIVELNFLGLPIRVLEKECPYYMRNGSCAYGVNCKFHHPDPVAAGGFDSSPTGVSLGGHSSGNYDGLSNSLQLIKESEPAVELCSSNLTLHNSAPFFDNLSSHSRGTHPDSKWIRPQGSMYQGARTGLTHSVPAENNNLLYSSNVSRYHQQQIEEFPERPGQPECSYFMKTGNCKYGSSCKFHHPKSRSSGSSVCTL
ncbi:zinc finger CCCH domain-containing protein 65-like isoform X3 [Pistacia vera]|uniref:zinc finger CCCH domain-containing protein 65-like isoform X3 n=1 Tax=Pistacia vera TaxID=55513 RepID=UPI0012634468|nr:zinc finger CCCH domain-containing protein 65-like isoform X3 [Pistacia vera]